MAEVPIPEEIEQLPLWPRVAFAARCARRIQPRFRLPEDHPDRIKHVRAIDGAIALSEQSAHANAYVKAGAYANAARAAAVAAVAAHDAHDAARAARAARAAAYAAVDAATEFIDAASNAAVADAVAYAAADAASAVRQDFETLVEHTRQSGWTDETPVLPTVFGPLWPDGEPAWFTEGKEWQRRVLAGEIGGNKDVFVGGEAAFEGAAAADSVPVPKVRVLWDPNALSDEDYARLVAAVGDVVRAGGGSRLVPVEESGTGTITLGTPDPAPVGGAS